MGFFDIFDDENAQFKKDVKNYLSRKNEWQVSDGHPWEMIEFLSDNAL